MAYIGNSPTNIQRGRRAQYHFTASVGQTAFTGTDDNGLTLDLLESVENDVYFNGARLILDDDYTISGDTLTLTAGAAAGDILVIVTQDDIVNLNSYTKAEADGRYINYDGDIINGDIQVVGNIDATSLESDSALINTSSSVGAYPAALEVLGLSGGRPLNLKVDITTSAGQITFHDPTGQIAQLGSNGGDMFLLGTNLGIGTTSPAKKFAVSSSGANGIEISPDDPTTSTNRILSYNRSTSTFTPLSIGADDIRFYIEDSEKVRIDSSGDIVTKGKIVIDGDTNNLSGGVGLEIIGRDGSSGVGYINYVASQGGNRLAAIGVPSVDEELVFDLYNRSNDTTYGRKLRLTNGASYFDDEDVYADGKKMTTDNKALAISLVFGG